MSAPMTRDRACDYETGRGYCYWRDDLIPKLEREKAALLGALEAACDSVAPDRFGDGRPTWYDTARAAIALAKGGDE